MLRKHQNYKNMPITKNVIGNNEKYKYSFFFLSGMEKSSAFVRTFGDYPLIRIIDFLIYSRDFDYPITEIAKNSDVNFQTLKKLWPRLEKEKIVIATRILGGTTLYKINTQNPVAMKIIEMNNFLCLSHMEKREKIAMRA